MICHPNRFATKSWTCVHAKDEEARSFYEHFDFIPSPVDPVQWFVLSRDVRRILLKSTTGMKKWFAARCERARSFVGFAPFVYGAKAAPSYGTPNF
jgi:hypothetical protein